MRIVFVVVGVLAALLLLVGLANGVWTALDMRDGACDRCMFPSVDQAGELVAVAVANIVLYGAIIALAAWGYRASKRRSPGEQ